jgi:Sec-independent protein translocase protein TatA
MTKRPPIQRQRAPKIQPSNPEFDSSWLLSCGVIPSFLGLSGLEPRLAFMAPGGGELLLILLVLILLFGAKDAPRILRNIQSVLNKLQRSAADFRYKLMYSDLHQPDEPASSEMYDVEESPDEEPENLPPENTPDEEPEPHEKSV